MKKLLLVVFILLYAGIAGATTQVIDAVNNHELWVTTVFNDETSTMDVGDCAEWKMDSSTGDNLNYVEQCDAVDTHIVAGVIWPVDIAAKSTGTMVIKGPVATDTLATAQPIGLLCASATGGSVALCSDSADDAAALGFSTATGSSNSAVVNVFLH